ncbi:AAA family ATPase, partial [bacterium]|nr:AAA family ATPase [bacterium]
MTKAETLETDRNFEDSIRPKTFEEYTGQSALKETLKITIEAAKKRNKPLDHLLFYGPPGLGKTTLAGVIAGQMGVEMKITSAP